MKFKIHFLCFTALAVSAVSCKKNNESPPAETPANYIAHLSNIGSNVIIETYSDLKTKAEDLESAIQVLLLNPSEANLLQARDAWRSARSPWEQSEGFLFGPVDQEGLDPALDSWPVNVVDLENVLNSSSTLTASFLEVQEGTLKGFHTIEFLLWGNDGNKTFSEFTDREFEYLAACSELLADDAGELFDLWSPDSGNFISNLFHAGESGSIYISQKSALEEIANALAVIADEVGNGKINDPLTQQDLSLEESRFSANSKADFADNMRSIKNIYTGYYLGYGNGISLNNIIQEHNATADADLLAAVEEAITAIEEIPGTFSDAVFNNTPEVEAAQQKVLAVKNILESEILPAISGL